MSFLFVALGGALGSVARHLVSLAYARVAPAAWMAAWPLGTFTVNALGSFALGWLSHWATGRTILGADARLFLGTGLLGGFTTYSSFNQETLRMMHSGEALRAALYVAAMTLVCILAGALGMGLSLRGAG